MLPAGDFQGDKVENDHSHIVQPRAVHHLRRRCADGLQLTALGGIRRLQTSTGQQTQVESSQVDMGSS